METWRSVPGFEGWYEVSDLGKVRSVERWVTDTRGRRYLYASRVLNPKVRKNGYLEVPLRRNGSVTYKRVHQLVLLAFVGPCPEGMEVRHKDRTRANCRLDNLHYGTHLENMADRANHGTHRNTVKTHCKRGHLLVSPNLVSSRLPLRDCLSCGRATSYLGMCRRSGKEIPDMLITANGYYTALGFELEEVVS